jgi:periplasmic divalent cation tolerance protein
LFGAKVQKKQSFMTNIRMVFCTCGTQEEAQRIARTLVDEYLAACVSVLPGVESVYRWQGTVESAQEVLLLIKTTEERLAELGERIVQLHSYDTPEILSLSVNQGFERYLHWAAEATHRPAD